MAESHTSRCPCGFWGTPQTLGLCSKCFKEHQKKSAEADSSSGNSMKSNLSTSDLTKAFEKVAASSTSGKETDIIVGEAEEEKPDAVKEQDTEDATAETKMETDGASVASQSTTKEPADEDNDETPSVSNGTSNKRDITEVQDSDRPVQKNKKRCFTCNIKLELAVREIGRCKCDYVFCQLHRLPEQHDCRFDHKEDGRQQAKEKMVSPKKHAGTSIKRMDSAS